jgi:hypothetical protein
VTQQLQQPTFNRKVFKHGHGRSLSVTKLLPTTWEYVKITVVRADQNEVVLKIKKLYGVNNNAQNTTTSARRKQNT